MFNLIKFNIISIFNKKNISLILLAIFVFFYTRINFIKEDNVVLLKGIEYFNLGEILVYILLKTTIIGILVGFIYNQIKNNIQNIVLRLKSLNMWMLSVIITTVIYLFICYSLIVLSSVVFNTFTDYNKFYINGNVLILNLLNSFLCILINLALIITFNKVAYLSSVYIIILQILSIRLFIVNKFIGGMIPINYSLIYIPQVNSIFNLYEMIIILIIFILITTLLLKNSFKYNFENIINTKGDF